MIKYFMALITLFVAAGTILAIVLASRGDMVGCMRIVEEGGVFLGSFIILFMIGSALKYAMDSVGDE